MLRARLFAAAGLAGVLSVLGGGTSAANPLKHPLPNLSVTKLTNPSGQVIVGSSLRLRIAIVNDGAATAGKSTAALYLAKGKTHRRNDRRLTRLKLEPLRPRKSAVRKLSAAIPSSVGTGTYRLIACADDAKRVREAKEGDNCRTSESFVVSPPPPNVAPPSPSGSAAPSFTMTDGLDWGFVQDTDRESPGAGEPVTTTLRVANGLPGQAGYTRSNIAPQPLLSGTSNKLGYPSTDDSAVSVILPFAFPFGGIEERSVSVGTNGWVSFGGSPAPDYWEDVAPSDYRGIDFVVGNYERGIMPYWADLDLANLGEGAGTVREVLAADAGSVAFQWDISQHSGGAARRVLQLVLFPDGRFRLDYPGKNPSGGSEAFIGYSLGTGPSGVDVVGASVESVPTSSLLYTPNPVKAEAALAAGQATMTLPPGSSFLSGEGGCTVSSAPTAENDGLLICPLPALAVGQALSRTVSFAMPPDFPGLGAPANFQYTGSYQAGAVKLADAEEINAFNTHLDQTTITPTVTPPANPKVNQDALFSVAITAGSGLDRPSVTFTLPANATLKSIQIAGTSIPCGAVSAGMVTCPLPSGLRNTGTHPITVTVVPTAAAAASELTLAASAQALNAPQVTASAKSTPVEP